MNKGYSNKYIISTGMGLQAVDGLSNSDYFVSESERYIKGEISLDEFDKLITSYYKTKPNVKLRSDEADLVSIRIGQLLSDDSFSFTVGQLSSIHAFLFKDIIKNAGKLRTYNFTKKEWVLDNASVSYGDYRQLKETLEYDFNVEKNFDYKNLSMDEIIDHLAIFIANLWQIHAFEEGNTRTAAVFMIKYLRHLGFEVSNDLFAKNAWYFRNALVRANYTNLSKGIYEDRSFLIKFLRNLILNEKNNLKNKELHIKAAPAKQLSVKEQILATLKDNPNMKLEDLSNELDVSLRTVKYMIKDLQDDEVLVRENGKRYGYWNVL